MSAAPVLSIIVGLRPGTLVVTDAASASCSIMHTIVPLLVLASLVAAAVSGASETRTGAGSRTLVHTSTAQC